jgi:hypothetical protein
MQRAEQWRRSQKTAAEKIEELLLEQEREDGRKATFSSPVSAEEQRIANDLFSTTDASQRMHRFLLSSLLSELCEQEATAPKPEQFGLTYAEIKDAVKHYRNRLSQGSLR